MWCVRRWRAGLGLGRIHLPSYLTREPPGPDGVGGLSHYLTREGANPPRTARSDVADKAIVTC